MRFLFQRVLKDDIIDPYYDWDGDDTSQSSAWFQAQAKKLKNYQPGRLMRRGAANAVERPMIRGEMFLFNYNPKGKDTLQYYDRFPVVVVLEINATHMLGLNFHYLPYRERAILMQRMYVQYLNNEEFDETTFFRNISYDKLSGASTKLKYFKPCLKRYINNNIVGRMVKIHPAEWDIVLQLPIERFVRARRERVWKDSRNMWNK